MTQHSVPHRPHIIGGDIVPAAQEGVACATRIRASEPRGLAPTRTDWVRFGTGRGPEPRVVKIRSMM
jgi:hypothetical protein